MCHLVSPWVQSHRNITGLDPHSPILRHENTDSAWDGMGSASDRRKNGQKVARFGCERPKLKVKHWTAWCSPGISCMFGEFEFSMTGGYPSVVRLPLDSSPWGYHFAASITRPRMTFIPASIKPASTWHMGKPWWSQGNFSQDDLLGWGVASCPGDQIIFWKTFDSKRADEDCWKLVGLT